MAVNSISFGGENAGAVDQRGLFLKVFSGEVLAAYRKNLLITPMVRNRTISHGKSAQFPITGRASAFFHTAGENLLTEQAAGSIANPTGAAANYLSKILAEEKVIHIDNKMIASCFIDDLDEAMSHYDYRSPFAAELGIALATQREQLIMRMIQKASAVTGAVDPHQNGGGATAIGAGGVYTVAQLVTGIYTMAQKMDENHIPKEGRVLAVTPAVFWELVQSKDIINRDFGGMGNLPKGLAPMIAGLEIVETAILKELFDEDTAAAAAFPSVAGAMNDYDGSDFRNTLGLCFQKEAVGSLTLQGLSMEMDYKAEYQGDLLLSKLAVGHGKLRPSAAQQLTVTP